MKHWLYLLFILLMLVSVVWRQSDITPTLQPIRSIFDYDICAPPCWMGLIPGESTAADAERVLEALGDQLSYWRPSSYNAVIDPETGYIIDGDYYFGWRNHFRSEFRQPSSLIGITASIVDIIILSANEQITFVQIMDMLGQPDDIRFVREQLYYLTFIYIDELTEIRFIISEGCTLRTTDEDADVEILYHSYASASELVETDYGLQPRLIAYTFPASVERQVPLDTFYSWLNAEEDSYCIDAWQSLPETVELPEFPEPEATATPTSTQESR